MTHQTLGTSRRKRLQSECSLQKTKSTGNLSFWYPVGLHLPPTCYDFEALWRQLTRKLRQKGFCLDGCSDIHAAWPPPGPIFARIGRTMGTYLVLFACSASQRTKPAEGRGVIMSPCHTLCKVLESGCPSPVSDFGELFRRFGTVLEPEQLKTNRKPAILPAWGGLGLSESDRCFGTLLGTRL